MKKYRKLIAYLLPLIWMGLIFYGSSRPKVSLSENYWLSFLFFKSLHVIEYGILFTLWRFALYGKPYSIKYSVTISLLYGAFDEIHQTFVPTREGRLRDVIIDLVGVLIFWLFLLERLEKIVKKKSLLRKLYLS